MAKKSPKTIRIECQGAATVALDTAIAFQGEMKVLSDAAYQQLRGAILDLGFSFPLNIWKKAGKNYIIDAHQRVAVLKRMRDEEGYEIPKLPVAWIQAKDEAEAARKVLAATSQFGDINAGGLYDFMAKYKIKAAELPKYKLPELDMTKFMTTYYPDKMNVTFQARTGERTGTQADDLEKFLSNDMRNIVLTYSHADHAKVVKHIDALKAKYKVDNASDAVLKFMEAHV